MKYLMTVIVCCLLSVAGYSQDHKIGLSKPDPSKEIKTVEAACGSCQFHIKSKACSLAVRIGGKVYPVDGIGIDSFGDAHAKDGLCKAVRKAEVQGEIVKNRFHATYFKLLPDN